LRDICNALNPGNGIPRFRLFNHWGKKNERIDSLL
jgi:hypothetical protein